MMNPSLFKLTAVSIVMLLTACSSLLPKPSIHTTYHSLDSPQVEVSKSGNTNHVLPTLIVNMPKAAAGFDTRHMMYTRSPHQLEYFARNEWVDTPSHMLQPLMVAAIEQSNGFNAVLPKLPAVKADLRLESEVIKLVQDFNTKPSQVHFSLRVTLIDYSTNEVIALHQFDEHVTAETDNPAGGVKAANLAVKQALVKISQFTQQLAVNWVKAK